MQLYAAVRLAAPPRSVAVVPVRIGSGVIKVSLSDVIVTSIQVRQP